MILAYMTCKFTFYPKTHFMTKCSFKISLNKSKYGERFLHKNQLVITRFEHLRVLCHNQSMHQSRPCWFPESSIPNPLNSGRSRIHPLGVGIQVEKEKKEKFSFGIDAFGKSMWLGNCRLGNMHLGKRHGPNWMLLRAFYPFLQWHINRWNVNFPWHSNNKWSKLVEAKQRLKNVNLKVQKIFKILLMKNTIWNKISFE